MFVRPWVRKTLCRIFIQALKPFPVGRRVPLPRSPAPRAGILFTAAPEALEGCPSFESSRLLTSHDPGPRARRAGRPAPPGKIGAPNSSFAPDQRAGRDRLPSPRPGHVCATSPELEWAETDESLWGKAVGPTEPVECGRRTRPTPPRPRVEGFRERFDCGLNLRRRCPVWPCARDPPARDFPRQRRNGCPPAGKVGRDRPGVRRQTKPRRLIVPAANDCWWPSTERRIRPAAGCGAFEDCSLPGADDDRGSERAPAFVWDPRRRMAAFQPKAGVKASV